MPALPAINNLRTTLSLPLSAIDTVATVASTVGFPDAGIFSVEDEIIEYTGRTPTTFTGLIRGYDGSIATTHVTSLTCSLRIIAKHLNDAAFINPSPTTIPVGGIPAGTTFADRTSVQEIIQQLLYPYQPPAFTSFNVSGYGGPLEVGSSIPASITFTWSTSNSGNVQASSLDIVDVTGGNITLASGLANDGSEAVVMGGPIQKLTAASHQFRVDGINTQSGSFSRNQTVSWLWKLYYGVDAAATLTAGQIAALAGDRLASSYGGTYACGAGGYKYICQADAAGGQINSVKDQLTGFNVPMATVAPYTNVDGGGFNYALVSFTNDQGVTTDYRVYRTSNSLGGAVTLVVT